MTTLPPSGRHVGPAAGEAGPLIELAPLIRCSAGSSVTFEVFITHRGASRSELRVTVLGLDGRWVPPPLPVGPIDPGETIRITLSLVPERGTLGARYPFVVAAEATAVSGRAAPVMGMAESILAVDGRDPIALTVSPLTPVAVFSRRIKVQITNPGHTDRELSLSGTAARGATVALSSTMVLVPAGRTVTVPGRVRVSHPRLIGQQNAHTFAVAARGQGAPEFAEGTLRSRPLVGSRITGLLVGVLVIALWATAAIVGIPKLSDRLAGGSADTTTTAKLAPGAANATSGAASGGGAGGTGSAGSGSGSGAPGPGTSGSGSPGSGSPGSGGPGSGAAAGAGQLSGTITGITPQGVQVSLEPTSLVEAAAAGARPAVGVTDPSTADALRSVSTGLGKIPADALRVAPTATDSGLRTTTSAADGTFSFAGISSPGYYLLTLAKPGFATQRYMVNAATLDPATPIKVALVPGDGALSGSVTSPTGAVGAASVTITDGTVALQTSTASTATAAGAAGSWTVRGLSTPGTYLVTVAATGFGASSRLVTLAAGGSGEADLTVQAGVAAISGTVNGVDDLGRLGGLGGVTVTATGTSNGVVATRTATTVTSGPVGAYSLPDLPVPGDYTVTVTGAGYAAQTQQVSLAAGSSAATVNVSLTRADGTVTGTVVGDGAEGGLIGAGLTLTGSAASYKTMTTSVPAGAFRFTGVPPGTYVLQGSQYGRVPSSATVVVSAAGTAIANLHLVGAPDTELPDTARIRGRAVDSRTQGPLTCDRASGPAPVCRVTASIQVPVAGNPGRTETITSGAGPAEDYTLPAVTDKAHAGLVAGLYAVTLSAPGYEPTTVNVQVAQGQVTSAPQVGLPPLGLITGTVTARAGAPAAPSCVVSVPDGVAVPTACTTAGAGCTAVGSTLARCVLTGTDGSYQLRGLVHGGYQVVVLPNDREYLPTTPFGVQLELGGDNRYDPVLDRLGRVTITVEQPDLKNLALTPAKGAVVGVVDTGGIGRGNPLAGDSTADDGVLTITGLNGSYTAQASGDIPTGLDGSVLAGTAAAPTGFVGLNQTVAVQLVLAAPIGAVVGHVTVSVDGENRDVTDTLIQISGVVGFSGGSAVSGAASITTDSFGCYAIVPVGWTGRYPLVSPDCPNPVNPSSVTTMQNAGRNTSLVALPIGVSVAQQGQTTQTYSATGVLIDFTGTVSVIPPISLLAQPSPVPALSLTLQAPGGSVGNPALADIVVTRKPAGAGNITVTASADGTLTWTDSQLGTGKAVPGTYLLTASELGYSTATPPKGDTTGMASGYATVWCDLGTACRFGTRDAPSSSWVLNQLPSITGTISAPNLPPGVTLSRATVAVTAKPSAAGSISVKVDDNGAVGYTDASLPAGLAQPTAPGAPYQFVVSLPGYTSGPVSVTCGADYTVGCTPLNATLVPLPRFSGSVEINPTITTIPPQDLTGISVSFTAQPNPAKPVVVSVDPGTGALTWRDPTQPDTVVTPGAYALAFSKNGYQTATVNLSCVAGAVTCTLGAPVVLNMFAAGAGTVSVDSLLPGASSVDWTRATVTLTNRAPGSDALGITVKQDPNDPLTGDFVWHDSTLPFNPVTQIGTTHSGTYALTVTLPGYGASSSNSFTCAAGDTACGPTVPALGRLAVFTGTVITQATVTPDNTGGLTGVTATVAAQPNAGSTITVGIDTTTGALSWSDNTQPAGIVAAGTYTVRFAKDGFQPVNSTFTCSAGTCGPGTVTLLEFPHGTGTVSVDSLLPGTTAVDWTRATVALTTQPAGSGALTVGLIGSGAATADLTWTDSSLPYTGITVPGTYVLVMSLPGYGSATSAPFTCSAGAVSCQPSPAMTLSRLPGIDGVVTVTPTITTSPPQGTDGVTVSVNSQPNPSNPVSVTVDPTTGRIGWNDPTQPAGVVTAGAYSLTFAKAGYLPVVKQFSCGATDSTCSLGTVALLMDPHGTGSVSVSALAPNATSVDWTKATVTLATQPPNTSTLVVALVADTDPRKANLRWTDSALPFSGITLPGAYTIRVSLPGYGSATSAPFTCAAGDLVCGPDLTLAQQPTFSGSVSTDPAGDPVLGAVVSVVSPAGVNAVTATVAATAADPTDGTIGWQEAGAPAGLVSFGTYQVSVSLPPYLPQSVAWTCSSTSCPALALVLTSTSSLQLTVTSAAGGHAPVNGATFDLSGTTVAPSTVTAPQTSNVLAFPGLSPLGDYTVVVHAAGYADGTFDRNSSAVTCTDSGGTAHTGLRVWPGGTTSCGVSLNPLGSITLHTSGVTRDGGTITSSVALASVPVTAQQLTGGGTPTGPVFSGTTSATGDLVLTGTNTAQGLLNGRWQVQAAQNGYTTRTGTVLIAATTYAMTADTGASALPITAGVLQLQLNVNPVALQVHLTVADTEALPAVTVSLAGGPTPLACSIKLSGSTYSCAETSNTGTVVNGAAKYVNFASVGPGVYTVSVTSATSTYRTVTLLAQIVAGLSPQQLVISLDERSSAQGGTLALADGTHPAGITATLRTQQNIAVIATDQNGQPLTTTTDSTGTYHFTGIPDGQYTLVGSYPGYAFAAYPSTVVENSSLTTTPPDLGLLQLTTRATRAVTLNFSSSAQPSTGDGNAVPLGGASVVLTPTDPSTPGLPADAAQTVPLTGTGSASLPQLGTGTWSVAITGQNNAPFPGVVSPGTITVAQPPVTASAPAAVSYPLAIKQALAALTVNFRNNSCVTAPTSLTLRITRAGSTATVTAPVVSGATTSSAVAQVYLPQGSYSFAPTVDPAMFSATATSFTVGAPGTSGAVLSPAPTATLVPARSPVAATMTVDSQLTGATGVVLTATDGNTSPTQPLDSGNSATLCLTPGRSWAVSVSAGTSGLQVAVPSTSITVSATAANNLALVADTVTPRVALAAVAGRVDSSSITVPVEIQRDGSTVYSGSAVGVTAAAPAVAAPVLVGTCTSCVYTLTATPPPGVFGAVTDQAFVPAKSLTVTATLPYTAAMATVLVTHGSNVVTVGATVTVTPADRTAPGTDGTGHTTFQDLIAGRAYVFKADWIDTTDPANPVHYQGTVNRTVAVGANSVTIPLTVVP